ncbi:MAG TPA: DUF3473 domain-containing protein [Candidatus Polarisedimenticolia bacterium]|nr:DUF3473 domain-containing protein [Candidatus Polarisedimenticolia bacterium]
MSPVKNVLTFDVEDWHQSTLDQSLPITERVRSNTHTILDLLAEKRALATFFVLGLVATRFPDVVRRIVAEGHELASHGNSHRPVHAMTREEFRVDLRRSLAILQEGAGTRVLGYRAPDFSINEGALWAIEVLAEEGLEYDSSIFPFAGPRYGIAFAPRLPFTVRCAANPRFLEFPLTTLEWLGVRLPAGGGGYFRLFPYAVTHTAVARLNRAGSPATTYFHPYEMDTKEIPQSPYPIPWRLRLSQGLLRGGVERKLRRLLSDFSWGPARDWLDERTRVAGGRMLEPPRTPAAEAPLLR